MSNSIAGFIDLLSSQVDRAVYVWGGDGENLSDMRDPAAWIERKETSAENAQKDIELYNKRVKAGIDPIRAFDCSGLVYWALNTLGLLKEDLSSRGLYAACDKITEAELRAGDLVFHAMETKDGEQHIVHVGVFVGDGYFVECRGRDVGVVKNKRKAGYWTHFGRFPGLTEQEPQPEPEPEPQPEPEPEPEPQPEPEPEPEPQPQQEPEPKQYYVKVLGGSVRVRNCDSVLGRTIGIVHNAAYKIKHQIGKEADRLPLIGPAPSGWYTVEYRGQTAYITNKPKYTEVVYE